MKEKAESSTIQDVIEGLSSFENRPALVQIQGDQAQERDGQTLRNDVCKLAKGLVKRGVKPGDRIAILAVGAAPTVVASLAILRTGAVVKLVHRLNFRYSSEGCSSETARGLKPDGLLAN